MAGKLKNQNLTEVSSEHGHVTYSNQHHHDGNLEQVHQNMSLNSGNRMNVSSEHLHGQSNVSYQTSQAIGSANRTNLEIIQSKHQQMYTRSSNSREKERKHA